ncbi:MULTISPECIES: LysE/ArgO family amino acid transporter [unclassified Janthinobacterium]|uniref:LysE/ArgO family amino acid transporter n=1 Tax=unclassified Janthinobacterium TaxID=2610881 RepID=UPI00034A60A1|nr:MULTISPECIES: LysE/ArgO family amino acid transporter [unclassified Janthinobacterium]MEC5160486.1 L-lysine exporter family protein LysE/ArgO [Janthinobacterium sp. CG_S6]
MDAAVFFKGMGLGASLIIAIGTQNAFLLKQGLQRHYVFTCTCICIACDVVLIAAGVAGMGSLITGAPSLLLWIKLAGALFLLGYALRAARAAWRPAALVVGSERAPASYMAVIGTTFALTLLNPHVYLDTVVLLGAIGGQQAGAGRYYFGAGAMLASAIWFASLGYGARFLAPLFAKPLAWRVLDGVIAIVMCAIAVSLLL